jgi:flagellin-like hook-associated protein FlgL
MAISSLKTVISGSMIKTLEKQAQGGLQSSPLKQGDSPGLNVTLRSTARNLAAGVQSLNVGISFVNVSRDVNSKLLNMVDRLEVLVSKASKGGASGATANAMREEFAAVATAFQQGIKKAKVNDQDVLDPDTLRQVLAQAGLKTEEIDELAGAFKQMTSLSKSVVNEDGSVTTSSDLIPVAEFGQAMRRASAAAQSDDPAEAEQDVSTSFRQIRDKLRTVGNRLRENIDALDKTTEVLKKNVDLARAAGFAFLEASNSVKGNEDPDKLAEEIRREVQSKAPRSLSQAHNLQAIIVAGLTSVEAETDKAKKSEK